MSILGTTDLGNGKLTVAVDHDPTVIATDCPSGSMIVNVTTGQWYRKRDDGSSTDVRDIYALETKVDGVQPGATSTPLSLTAPVNVTKASAAAGTATEASRQDHKHDITTAAPATGIGGSNAEGTATSVARSDHNHALRETAGPTDLTIGAIANGEYLRRSGATIVGGSPGGGVFGANYQIAVDDTRTTTTANAYGGAGTTKLTLVTPALTGTYRVAAFAVLDQGGANQIGWARLYNSTDAVALGEANHRPSNTNVQTAVALRGPDVVFTGAAKTFTLQFRSDVAGNTTGCRWARIELWRVS